MTVLLSVQLTQLKEWEQAHQRGNGERHVVGLGGIEMLQEQVENHQEEGGADAE
jgi:hypothetical protein